MCSNKKDEIIRRLGITETYFHNEIEGGSSINSTIIRISSEIDLLKHKKLVNKACKLWMKSHQITRSRVVKLDENEHKKRCEQSQDQSNNLPGFDKYFAFIEETDEYKRKMDIKNEDEYLDHLSFLYYKQDENNSNHFDDCADFWKMLIERELTIPIDWKHGPMWRLTIIYLKKEISSNKKDWHEFVFLYSASHAIFDGSSGFAGIVSFLAIIQYLYDNITNQDSILQHIVDAKVPKSVEDYMKDYLKETNSTYEKLGTYYKLEGFKIPSSFVINKKNERTLSFPVNDLSFLKSTINSYPKAAFYSAVTNQPIVKLSELMELSKNAITKFRLSAFEGDQFKKFVSKCKSKNAKITGVVNIMFILAWRMTYKKFPHLVQNNENPSKTDPAILKEKINYLTIVNLRSYLNGDPNSMSWLCNYLNFSFDEEMHINDDSFWSTKFWDFSRQESQSLHDRLKTGEQLRLCEISLPLNADESKLHFGLSNVFIPNFLIQDLTKFRFNQFYTFTSYRKDWKNDFSYNNVVTVNDTMCWTCSYNSFFVRTEVIDFFHETVYEIYNKLLSEA